MNTYWLIECPDYDKLFGRSHVAWLGLQSRGTPTDSVRYHDVWVSDVHKAVRFCTKESAETVLSMLSLSPGNLIATEHEDASPPAAQEQKPVAELEVRNGIVSLKHTLAPIEQFYDGMKLFSSPIPASGWEPIETAPTRFRPPIDPYIKLGPSILGLYGKAFYCVCQWSEAQDAWVHVDDANHRVAFQPSHWMPLPVAPGETK